MGAAARRQRRETHFSTIPGFRNNWLTLRELRQIGMRQGNVMKLITKIYVVVSAILEARSGLSATILKVGDEAPDFTLPGSDGKETTLSTFKGKRNVVLAFFKEALTGG